MGSWILRGAFIGSSIEWFDDGDDTQWSDARSDSSMHMRQWGRNNQRDHSRLNSSIIQMQECLISHLMSGPGIS